MDILKQYKGSADWDIYMETDCGLLGFLLPPETEQVLRVLQTAPPAGAQRDLALPVPNR